MVADVYHYLASISLRKNQYSRSIRGSRTAAYDKSAFPKVAQQFFRLSQRIHIQVIVILVLIERRCIALINRVHGRVVEPFALVKNHGILADRFVNLVDPRLEHLFQIHHVA